MNQTMAEHVDGGLSLLPDNAVDERLMNALFRLHVQEQDFPIGGLESLQADSRRAADLALAGYLFLVRALFCFARFFRALPAWVWGAGRIECRASSVSLFHWASRARWRSISVARAG
jgi:hypothetical protein